MSDSVSASPPAAAPTENERTWGMLAHLSAFFGLVLPLVGNSIGPFVLWVSRRDRSDFVADQAREALNFNLSVTLAAIVCALLWLVFIGILLSIALFVAWLVMTLIAAIKASEGVLYRYPISLRLVK